jgi:hypothetical protein
VRHDETIGNDMDDEVLDPGEELHLVQALKIGINRQDNLKLMRYTVRKKNFDCDTGRIMYMGDKK